MTQPTYVRWFAESASRRAAGRRQERLARRDVPRAARRGHPRAQRLRRHGRGLPRRRSTRAGLAAAARELLDGLDRRDIERLARARAQAARDRLRRGTAATTCGGDPRGLSPSSRRSTARTRRRGAQLGDGRRPADGELRRPAGDLSSTCAASGRCSSRAGAASLRSSPTGRSPTASTRASTISRSPCRSACRRWCARTSARAGVMFTLDTESGFRDVVFITGA